MRHGRAFRRLGRDTAHLRSLLRNLTTSLFKHERIYTTEAKAKELRRPAEKMITLAKKGTEQARKMAQGWVFEKDVVEKLFSQLGPRYQARPGGYTRILKAGVRDNDKASMVYMELVDNTLPPLKLTRAELEELAKEVKVLEKSS